ncbi:MAG: cytoplasmic protein [Candidatus Altiarchaeota archaeon]|nr:cytoplasmic protein [Candidatus Altiarchaeota archaeon]
MSEKELERIIEKHLKEFYTRRIQAASSLKLDNFLKRKNPYLFRAIGTEKASDLVDMILKAYLNSSDETIFGDAFFEPIAIEVSKGVVSPAEGVDFAIETRRKYIAVSMKSGPNIFNSSQRKKQNEQFRALKQRLYKLHKQYDPILGHGYGRKNSRSANIIYRDLSGQKFWEEITGDPDFYLKLMQLMKDVPQKHKPEYIKLWGAAVNRFTKEFIEKYCLEDGSIDWDKLVRLSSEAKE